MNIVLVHGIYSISTIFHLMRTSFEEKGFTCFCPTLKPISAKFGLDDLAAKLKNEIDKNIDQSSEFILVGFSMGGIICRYYLQELGGSKRVKIYFTISAPHHGSYLAYLHSGLGAKQLRPKSNFLKKLESNEELLKPIDIYSFRTPFDLSIIPSSSSKWDIAINRKYYSILHPLMLFNRKLIKDMLKIMLNYN